jgi:hypothetical protein
LDFRNKNGCQQKLKEFNDNLIEKKSAKTSGKNVYNKEYDFTIYTDAATYIENGDYHSYTFPIVQGPDEKITNVLFELNDENEYDAYLVKYDYTSNELKYKDLNSLSLKTSIKPIDLDFNSLFARTSTAYFCVYTYEYISDGELRGAGNEVYVWVLTASYCETVNYYDEDYKEYQQGNTATVTIGGTTYGGTGGSKTSPMPSPFNAEELAKIDVVKNILNLNHPESLWIDKWENGQYAFKLHDFGATNMWSDEAIDFAYQAFVTLMNDNGEVDFDDQIINELSGKAKCIYDKLKSSSMGFKNAIKKFEPEFPVAHLKFEADATMSSNTKKAYTRAPENYIIDIVLNGNPIKDASYQKRPNLLVAKTIIHEVIHAEMFRKLLSVLDNGGNIDGVTRQNVLDALDGNFPGMYDYFRRHKNWQHQQMATHYRETLARILQEYDTGIFVPDNQQPLQLYMDLAWEGLRYPNIHTWTSLSQTERNRIDGVIADYISDNPNETCTE